MSEIKRRKADHIDICVERDINTHYNYWDDIHLEHCALPEVDLDAVDLTTECFGATLGAPIIISAMTGGSARARTINARLACAAAEHRIGFGVGSQRAAREHPEEEKSFEIVSEYDIPLVIANFGAPQLVRQQHHRAYTLEDARAIMDMVDAEILAIHLNYLQELIQPEGDCRAAGCLDAIAALANELPVLAKETGAGIGVEVAVMLQDAGVIGIDVGGVSGTSFAAVESYRAAMRGDVHHQRLGELFWDWGIPTPVAVRELADEDRFRLPVIATGGVRHGLDVARALALGATSAGIARALLEPALESAEAVCSTLDRILQQLRGALFLLGAESIGEARYKSVRITGRTRTWLDAD